MSDEDPDPAPDPDVVEFTVRHRMSVEEAEETMSWSLRVPRWFLAWYRRKLVERYGSTYGRIGRTVMLAVREYFDRLEEDGLEAYR